MSKENEYQTKEYVPVGPVFIKRPQKTKAINIVKQNSLYTFDIKTAKPGWLYDAHTGLCLGPASDEMKAEHKPGNIWERSIAGMKQKVVIG